MSSTDHLLELESLRSQVADLSRALAEREQSMSAQRHHFEEEIQDHRERSQLLRTLIEGTAAETGEEFFAALVNHLTSTLHVQYAVIGEVSEGQPKKIRTLAVSAGGTLTDNFEYELTHTPCATALTQIFACFDRDVQARFPQFQRLADLGAESYCGVPLRTKGGAVVGLLVVMDTKPLQQTDDLRALLEVFAPRVVAEFERRRAEQERAQALADLQNVIETVPDVMFTLNTQGNMVKWNRRVSDVTGYSSEELLNKSALVFVPPEEQARTASAIQRAFTEGYAELEGLLLTKDLRTIPYHWTGALLKNAQGEPIGITGIGRDVSEKKQAEKALRASEERWQLAVQGSNDSIWDWNIQSGDIFFPSRWKAIRGFEDHEITNHTDEWRSRIHPDDLDRVLQRLDAYVAKQRSEFCEEYRVQRKDGSYIWILGRGVALWADDGTPIRMAGSETDITERKRTEEALRERQSQLTEAQYLAKIGSWSWTIETDTVIWSDELYTLFGRDPSQPAVSYKDYPKIYAVDSYARLDKAVTQALATGEHYELELEFIHTDGTHRWGVARGEPIWSDEGQVIRLHGTFQDITERRRAKETLVQSERQLRTVLDALPVGVWFTDQSGKPVLSNPAAKQIWSGIKQVGIKTVADADGWWEAIEPSDTFHRWALSQTLTKGVPSLNEILDLECLDGTMKTIRNTTVPVRDKDGGILGALVLNEDVTVLRQMQGALKLTQSSVDHAVEGFFWIDSEARILNVNSAACRMLEYTRDELTTMTVHDVDPAFPQELWPARWEGLQRKGSLTFESKYWSKTGRILDMEVTVNCLDYEGRQYICAIMRDIGERKRADAALRESEERYRSLYDETPIMYFTLATDGRVRSVNRFGADQLGYRVEEIVGHSVLDIFHEDDKKTAAACLTECLATPEKVRHWEFRKVRKDERIMWVQETACVGQSLTGETIVSVTCEDVTDRKRMEEALRQRGQDLSAAIEERERISQDLHDGILQSLFAVGLTLETAKFMMSPRSRKTFGQPLDQAIDQLNHVMREIRNFIVGLGSDLLKGRDLPTALRQMLKSLTENQPTRVRLAIEDRAVQVLSTEQSLHLLLIIQEAVSNCIQHGRAQEARVSLKMLKQGIRMSVRDNGSGFKLKTPGRTGHGLTNMAARAKKIGGRFTVVSKVNEGTRIEIDLPKEAAHVCV